MIDTLHLAHTDLLRAAIYINIGRLHSTAFSHKRVGIALCWKGGGECLER